jgi:hypothetical protein
MCAVPPHPPPLRQLSVLPLPLRLLQEPLPPPPQHQTSVPLLPPPPLQHQTSVPLQLLQSFVVSLLKIIVSLHFLIMEPRPLIQLIILSNFHH